MGSRGIFMLKICDPFRISLRHTSLNGRRLSALCAQRQVKLLAQKCVLPASHFYPTIKSPSSAQLYCKNSSNPVDEKGKIEQMPKDRVENIFTIPNFLTVSRMAMCPVLGYLVIHQNYPTALGLFVVAGVTDLLDGWIARTFPNQSSLAGSFLDPMADKLLIGTLFITLTLSGIIPVPLTALIIIRDALLVGAGFYVRYISLAPPMTLSRYFDATLVSAQLAPTTISKFNTAIQLLLVATSLAVPAFELSQEYLPLLWYVTGTTTVLSGLSYVFTKNTYRIMTRPRAK